MLFWNENSLVVITEYKEPNFIGMFYFSNRGEKSVVIENNENIRKTICKAIQLYNCSKTGKDVNCRKLAAEIFTQLKKIVVENEEDKLELTSEITSDSNKVGYYLNYISLQTEKRVCACIVDSKKSIELKWEDHKELDEYWSNNEAGLNNALFLAFHRAFKYRYLFENNNSKEGDPCAYNEPTSGNDK